MLSVAYKIVSSIVKGTFCVVFALEKATERVVCPRVWGLETRLKLLGIVTLVYAFLLHLLDPVYQELLQALLRLKCQRTGKRCRDVLAPLYRLRWAISRLCNETQARLESIFSRRREVLRVLQSFSC
jgi:hypothetical protein